MYKAELYINDQRVDLFDDEPISVVSSVQNIDDISRVFNDFSHSFSVPASKKNNQIFRHYYNASITNGFDARVRHAARIEINSIPFKTGTVRLEKCTVKNNHIVDYRLTFFGLLIDLKDTIGDDYINVLDLSAYDIGYESDNVKTGVTTGYGSEDYIFPLISTQRQWFYNSNSANETYTDVLANIGWNSSSGTHGFHWTSLRPALKVMRIIEAIETHYGLAFSRDFFGNDATENMYLWMANADTEDALQSKNRITDYDTANYYQPQIGSFDNFTGAWTPTQTGAAKVRNIIFLTDSVDGVAYTIQLMSNATVLEEKSGTGNLKIDRNFPGGLNFGDSVYGRVVTTAAKTVTLIRFEIDELSDDQVLFAEKTNVSFSGTTAQVVDFIPKIKVMDFLASLIRLFNLTIEPTSSTEFTVYSLDDWYATGNIYDVSQYIDTSEVTVNRSKIYKNISFKFQEPQTILAVQYDKKNNVAYGDLETKLKNSDGTPLDGEEFEIELDFEQMVYEKLFDLDDDSETNIVYGLSLDMSLSEVTPEPHMMYVKKVDVSGNPLSMVNDTENDEQLNTFAFMPSHVYSTYSTTFGSELDEHTNATISDTLFSNYYKDYITDSFSSRRRKFDYDGVFPVWLLNTLKLNDRLIINGDRYIINQATIEVTSGKVQLELLNDIYNLPTATSESESPTVEEETPVNPTKPPVKPTTADSFSVSESGGSTLAQGCALSPNTIRYYDDVVGYPTLANIIYTTPSKTTKFAGGNLYYKIANSRVIKITDLGVVIDIYDCDAGANL